MGFGRDFLRGIGGYLNPQAFAAIERRQLREAAATKNQTLLDREDAFRQKTFDRQDARFAQQDQAAKRKQLIDLRSSGQIGDEDFTRVATENGWADLITPNTLPQSQQVFGQPQQGPAQPQSVIQPKPTKSKLSGITLSRRNPDGGLSNPVTFRRKDPRVADLLDSGDYVEVPISVSGKDLKSVGSNKSKQKELVDLRNMRVGIMTANDIGKQVFNNISDESVSVAGGLSKIATNLKSQVNAVASTLGTKWENGTNFSPSSYDNVFKENAISNAKVRGEITVLARMLATASGEGKVLSDADMTRWIKVLSQASGSADLTKTAIKDAISIQNRSFRRRWKLTRPDDELEAGSLGFFDQPETQKGQSTVGRFTIVAE